MRRAHEPIAFSNQNARRAKVAAYVGGKKRMFLIGCKNAWTNIQPNWRFAA